MISDCAYCGILELNEVSFFADVAALSVLVVPGVIVFTLWRMFVTNKQPPVVLGLDRSASLHPTLIPQEVSVYFACAVFADERDHVRCRDPILRLMAFMT